VNLRDPSGLVLVGYFAKLVQGQYTSVSKADWSDDLFGGTYFSHSISWYLSVKLTAIPGDSGINLRARSNFYYGDFFLPWLNKGGKDPTRAYRYELETLEVGEQINVSCNQTTGILAATSPTKTLMARTTDGLFRLILAIHVVPQGNTLTIDTAAS